MYLDKSIIANKVKELKEKYGNEVIISHSDDSFYSRCMDGALQRVYIGADGIVSPCDQLHYAIVRLGSTSDGKSGHYSLGALSESSLYELVSKKEYIDFVMN